MKKAMMIAATVLFTSGYAVANGPGGDETTYTIDAKRSQIVWTGKKVTGEHTGTLMLKSGRIIANGNILTNTDITIDMKSIVVTDIEDETYNKKLTGHLNSEDFFSTEKNPTASFKATSFEMIKGATKGEANYTVTGKLTIKGITNEITFPAMVTLTDGKLTAKATASFDRTKWDIKYRSDSFFEGLGDKVIYDDVEFEFNLVATVN